MTDNLSRFGVPLSSGKRAGIMQPLASYRFRLNTSFVSVMANTESVHVDFAKQKIHVNVRATVQGEDFEQGIRFGNRCHFAIDAMDGGNNGVLFTLAPQSLVLDAYDVEFDYGKSDKLMHSYTFGFSGMDVRYLVPSEGEEPKDLNFPTPQEAMAELEKSKTSKQILTDEAPKSNTVTIMDDPIERDAGC